jgi:hypothetical protein
MTIRRSALGQPTVAAEASLRALASGRSEHYSLPHGPRRIGEGRHELQRRLVTDCPRCLSRPCTPRSARRRPVSLRSPREQQRRLGMGIPLGRPDPSPT